MDNSEEKNKHGFWGSLVRQGTGVSSLNFYLLATTIIGIGLLSTIIFCIIWEVLHNNMVQSDLSGWAAIVGAISTLFASAGIAKGWSNWSEHKFLGQAEDCSYQEDIDYEDESCDGEGCEMVEASGPPKAARSRRSYKRKK